MLTPRMYPVVFYIRSFNNDIYNSLNILNEEEFENILEQFKTLDALDLDDVVEKRPTVSVTRKDIPKKCEIEDLFRNVKTMRDTAIEVPKIIE